MGARPRLAHQHTTRPRPGILAALLQPPPTPRLTRRPATHQPRSPRPWAGQLAAALEQQDALARRREPVRERAAARARPDDDRVVVIRGGSPRRGRSAKSTRRWRRAVSGG